MFVLIVILVCGCAKAKSVRIRSSSLVFVLLSKADESLRTPGKNGEVRTVHWGSVRRWQLCFLEREGFVFPES